MQINRLTSIFFLILSLLLTTVIYSTGLSGDFAFDDFPNLLHNKKIHLETLSVDSLVTASLSSDSGILKRPVSMASFALNRYFFGMSPYSFKIVNLIIHLLTGLGIFFLSSLILKRYNAYCKQEFSKSTLYLLPLFISSIWLIHPLNLTSVLYIVQRMTSLSALFTIWAACAYIWTRSRYYDKNNGFWLIPLTILFFGSLAILSKENGILLPLFLLLIEIILFRFRKIDGEYDKKIIALFTVLLIIPAILSITILLIKPDLLFGGYSIREFTLTERLLTETRVLLFYLKMTLMPSINELGLYHDDIIISRSLIDPLSTLFATITIFSFIILALLNIKKQPLIAFGILWFFAAHLLESTIISLEIAHEHRNYIANFGIIFSLVYLIAKLPIYNMHSLIKYAIYLFPIILLAYVTNLRSYQWSDNILQAVYEAKHHPNSARATYSAGRIYANLVITGDKDKITDAYKQLERSSSLSNGNILPDTAMILLSAKLKLPIKDTWVKSIKYKLANYPIIPTTADSLMELIKCQNTNCKIDNKVIDDFFSIALSKNARKDADIVSIYAHHMTYNKRNLQKGEQLYTEATIISPHNVQYRINLIKLLLSIKQYDKVTPQVEFLRRNNSLGENNILIQEIEMAMEAGSKSI